MVWRVTLPLAVRASVGIVASAASPPGKLAAIATSVCRFMASLWTSVSSKSRLTTRARAATDGRRSTFAAIDFASTQAGAVKRRRVIVELRSGGHCAVRRLGTSSDSD